MSHFSPILWLYQLGTILFTPFWPLLLLWRLRKGKEDAARWHERRGWPSVQRPDGPLIWVHAASIGELNAALPLIERLSNTYPALLVTTGTVTSAQVAVARLPKGVIHQYVPLDCPSYLKRFYAYWKPNFGVMMESELWPNMLLIGRQMGCHFVLVNGRMSDRSFKRWHNFAPHTVKVLLSQFDVCLCQNDADTIRFTQLGAGRAVTIGNIKYDASLPNPDPAIIKQLQILTHGRPIIVAASTHLGEETVVMKVHSALMSYFPTLLTIIVPRHPHRGAEIAALAKLLSLNVETRSAGEVPNSKCDIYVADTIGELSMFYRMADLVFMGGSLVPHGGQNPIEPAQLKKPIFTGPHTHNFTSIYAILNEAECLIRVKTAEEFASKAHTLLSQPKLLKQLGVRALEAVESQQGAVDRTIQALEPFLLDCAIKPK